jgi:hypothetical protein
MKNRFLWAALLLAGLSSTSQSATRGDVKVLEAADSIRYNASKLTKEYLLYLLHPQKKVLKKSLQGRFLALDEDMHDIAISTKDPKTKGVLKYFAFEKVRIGEILKQKPTRENATELLDFSESFKEGATAIAKRHLYVPAPEEAMWIVTRSLDQELEEIVKYYIAHEIVRDDPELKHKLTAAVARFKKALEKINQYTYDEKLKKKRTQLNQLWKTLEGYLAKADKLPLPIIATLMGDELESSIDTLGVYHSKNH